MKCIVCSNPSYKDGNTRYALCLFHLKEMKLGPFYPSLPRNGDDYADW